MNTDDCTLLTFNPALCLNQQFAAFVALAELHAVAPAPQRAAMQAAAESYYASLSAAISDFIRRQAECPDYVLHAQRESPKLMRERLNHYDKLYHLYPTDDDPRPASRMDEMLMQLDTALDQLNSNLSLPSPEALASLYLRMQSRADPRRRLLGQAQVAYNNWMLDCNSHPSDQQASDYRAAILADLRGLPMEKKLAEAFNEQYPSLSDFHIAVARCYYTLCRRGSQVDLKQFMQFVYRFEVGAAFYTPTHLAMPEGMTEILAFMARNPAIADPRHTTQQIAQLMAAFMADKRIESYLTSSQGENFKGISLPAFANLIGLMAVNGLIQGSDTDLANLFFGSDSPLYKRQAVGTARNNIGNGRRFDGQRQEMLKPIIEDLISSVPRVQQAR